MSIRNKRSDASSSAAKKGRQSTENSTRRVTVRIVIQDEKQQVSATPVKSLCAVLRFPFLQNTSVRPTNHNEEETSNNKKKSPTSHHKSTITNRNEEILLSPSARPSEATVQSSHLIISSGTLTRSKQKTFRPTGNLKNNYFYDTPDSLRAIKRKTPVEFYSATAKRPNTFLPLGKDSSITCMKKKMRRFGRITRMHQIILLVN